MPVPGATVMFVAESDDGSRSNSVISFVPDLRTAIFTAFISVNHTLSSASIARPYGMLSGVGVGSSLNVSVTGSKRPI